MTNCLVTISNDLLMQTNYFCCLKNAAVWGRFFTSRWQRESSNETTWPASILWFSLIQLQGCHMISSVIHLLINSFSSVQAILRSEIVGEVSVWTAVWLMWSWCCLTVSWVRPSTCWTRTTASIASRPGTTRWATAASPTMHLCSCKCILSSSSCSHYC